MTFPSSSAAATRASHSADEGADAADDAPVVSSVVVAVVPVSSPLVASVAGALVVTGAAVVAAAVTGAASVAPGATVPASPLASSSSSPPHAASVSAAASDAAAIRRPVLRRIVDRCGPPSDVPGAGHRAGHLPMIIIICCFGRRCQAESSSRWPTRPWDAVVPSAAGRAKEGTMAADATPANEASPELPWTAAGPRRSVKTSEAVMVLLVRDMVARGLTSGDRLPTEAEMMRQYGVSRASLREAIRLLEVQGLITLKPGPGAGPPWEPRTTATSPGRRRCTCTSAG